MHRTRHIDVYRFWWWARADLELSVEYLIQGSKQHTTPSASLNGVMGPPGPFWRCRRVFIGLWRPNVGMGNAVPLLWLGKGQFRIALGFIGIDFDVASGHVQDHLDISSKQPRDRVHIASTSETLTSNMWVVINWQGILEKVSNTMLVVRCWWSLSWK